MKENDYELDSSDEAVPAKPYEQQPGEPHLWYARFRRFCELGPPRSLLQCYRVVMAERDAAAIPGSGKNGSRDLGNETAPQRSNIPQAWRIKARAYDWEGRAKAWDADMSELKQEQADALLKLADMADRKGLQFQLNLVDGWMEGPDGEMIAVKDVYQRRMAARELQIWASRVRERLQAAPTEKRAMIQVREVVFSGPSNRAD